MFFLIFLFNCSRRWYREHWWWVRRWPPLSILRSRTITLWQLDQCAGSKSGHLLCAHFYPYFISFGVHLLVSVACSVGRNSCGLRSLIEPRSSKALRMFRIRGNFKTGLWLIWSGKGICFMGSDYIIHIVFQKTRDPLQYIKYAPMFNQYKSTVISEYTAHTSLRIDTTLSVKDGQCSFAPQN